MRTRHGLRLTILRKTLFEKRWMLVGWFVAMCVANVLLIQLFPPLRDAFSGMMTDLPESLSGWFGDGAIWNTIEGYVGLEIMGQMAAVIAIFGIVFGIGIFAGEEKTGVMLTQLARPVSRTRYLVEKWLALAAGMLVVMVGFWLGAYLGTVILGEVIGLGALVAPCLAVLLLGLAFGSLAFGIGAVFGRSSLAGAVVGAYAAAGYFIVALRGSAGVLEGISKLSPFYWYNNPAVLENGLRLGNALVLLGFVIVPPVVGWLVFRKRDLRTR